MNKFKKHVEKAISKGVKFATIRRDVLKRLIEKGEYYKLVCDYSYTDDYAWDAETNYGKGEVKDISKVTYWLDSKTTCYIDVKEPNKVNISPYQGLSYSLYLEKPVEEEMAAKKDNVLDFSTRLKEKRANQKN